MERYFIVDGVVTRCSYSPDFITPDYDNIVDRSSWSPESDAMNNRISASQGASTGQGVYDDADNLPSDLEVRIRSGKLDKAEVDLAVKQFVEESKKEADEKAKADELDKAKKISEARQAYLDSATGFKSVVETKVNQ